MFRSSVVLLAATVSLSALSPAFAKDATHDQIVIVSFDGAMDNALWDKSMAMAEATGARFTYFVSCTFLMSPDERKAYRAPHQRKGRSNVGFAPSAQDVHTRLDAIWRAKTDGHEIASHGCGHFDGKAWSADDWFNELETSRRIMESAWDSNGFADEEPAGWRNFVRGNVIGFRAPYLSTNDALYRALPRAGFSYDASGVSNGPVEPDTGDELARFSLPMIAEGPRQRPVIAMDYNLFVRHSAGVETPKKSAEFEQRSYEAFKAAFDAEYDGERRPLQFGFHFVEMNGGAYWRALDRLLTETCGKADVRCIPYADYLSETRPAAAAADGEGF